MPWFTFLVLTVTTGCMPYVVPPATGAVGAHRTLASGDRTGVHAELGLSPFQLTPGYLARSFDATVSATFDHAERTAWGAAVAAGPLLHPWGASPSRDVTNRLAPQLVGRYTTEGVGAAVRVTLERATFVNNPTESIDSIGHSYGEGAIGLYVEAGMDWPEMRERVWSLGLGLSFRIPASVGVVCCIKP